jgi:FkbM family methyltransferase
MESIKDSWGEDDQVVNEAINGHFDEHLSLSLWCHWVRRASRNEIFLDIGAYTGIFSLAAAAHSRECRVVAFEPSTITFGRLAKNVLLNLFDIRIVPVNLAAGEVIARTEFPHRFGVYSLCSGESSQTEDPDHTQPVMIVNVDELLAGRSGVPYLNSKSSSLFPFERVAAIKIDVEGAELNVLRGARGIIDRDKPMIIAEALSEQFADQLAALAKTFDYNCVHVPNERNVVLFPAGAVPDLYAPNLDAKSFVSGTRSSTYIVQ